MTPTDAAPDTALTLTPDVVAKRLKISRKSVVMLMATGRLKAENKGRGKHDYWRTSEAWLADFLGPRGQTVRFAVATTPARAGKCPVRGLEFGQPVLS